MAVAVAAGCGQRGPLTLPDDARPIERLPQPTAPATPQDDEEEQRNER
jgi:predicted small lipoprotein YifL